MTRGDIPNENVRSGWSWSCSMPTSRTSQWLQGPTLRFHVHNSHGHLHRVQFLDFNQNWSFPCCLLCSGLHTLNSHGGSHSSCRVSGVWCNTSSSDSLSRSERIHMVTLTNSDATFQAFPQKYLTCLNTSAASS